MRHVHGHSKPSFDREKWPAIGTCTMASNSSKEGNARAKPWPSFTSGEKAKTRLRHGTRFNQLSLFKSAGRDTTTLLPPSLTSCLHRTPPKGQFCSLCGTGHDPPTSQLVPPFPVSSNTLPRKRRIYTSTYTRVDRRG